MTLEERVTHLERLLAGPALVFTVNEVCKVLGISRPTVYKLMDEGCLEYIQIYSHRRILAASIDEYVNHLRENRVANKVTAVAEFVVNAGDYKASNPRIHNS